MTAFVVRHGFATAEFSLPPSHALMFPFITLLPVFARDLLSVGIAGALSILTLAAGAANQIA